MDVKFPSSFLSSSANSECKGMVFFSRDSLNDNCHRLSYILAVFSTFGNSFLTGISTKRAKFSAIFFSST